MQMEKRLEEGRLTRRGRGTASGLDKRRAASDGRTSDSRLREETALTGVRFSRFLFARVTGDSEEVRSEGGAQLLSITATSTLRWKKGSEQMLEKAAPEKNKRVTFVMEATRTRSAARSWATIPPERRPMGNNGQGNEGNGGGCLTWEMGSMPGQPQREEDEEKAKKGPPSQGSKTLLPSCLEVLTAKCLALPLAWSRGGFGPEVPGSVWNSGAGGVERLVGLPGTLRTTQPRRWRRAEPPERSDSTGKTMIKDCEVVTKSLRHRNWWFIGD
ncbi:hypothetical protein GE21DRAFT_3498 [Neurospora crassa]|uniref:Uncharacterized protein n=1 Tax=Neurospora crassa (strain ATCC 24698 / 74-OR23-1A / CBS 708.71 / DSM 1257 / FGSC 987) TaxID=367110 RepID=Q7RWC6_NEUCR|nr:hypothetical protein NCU01488 [Neurospora crassa OR74A]EAA26685.1 hypothetical protein NCU01488 [Neurospora crassa OR74A]KHE80487.1 hypothetical protein GE21DRAFT_3498 [Neurospora crassa]|eukprot:XP_955921.1 hypothetical protein NCU01488 [Neurospora crassa OR74A]